MCMWVCRGATRRVFRTATVLGERRALRGVPTPRANGRCNFRGATRLSAASWCERTRRADVTDPRSKWAAPLVEPHASSMLHMAGLARALRHEPTPMESERLDGD